MLKIESKSHYKNTNRKSQRDYYLNEQLKAIHKELGEEDVKDEVNEIAKKIKKSNYLKKLKRRQKLKLKKIKSNECLFHQKQILLEII